MGGATSVENQKKFSPFLTKEPPKNRGRYSQQPGNKSIASLIGALSGHLENFTLRRWSQELNPTAKEIFRLNNALSAYKSRINRRVDYHVLPARKRYRPKYTKLEITASSKPNTNQENKPADLYLRRIFLHLINISKRNNLLFNPWEIYNTIPFVGGEKSTNTYYLAEAALGLARILTQPPPLNYFPGKLYSRIYTPTEKQKIEFDAVFLPSIKGSAYPDRGDLFNICFSGKRPYKTIELKSGLKAVFATPERVNKPLNEHIRQLYAQLALAIIWWSNETNSDFNFPQSLDLWYLRGWHPHVLFSYAIDENFLTKWRDGLIENIDFDVKHHDNMLLLDQIDAAISKINNDTKRF